MIQFDPKKISKGSERIPEQGDSGVPVVGPMDGHLGDAAPECLGEEKDFRVENPAVDFLNPEDPLGRRGPETLEPAGDIVDPLDQKAVGKDGEDFPHDLPMPGLMDQDHGVPVLTGTDDDIVIAQKREETIGFLERGGEVDVKKENRLARGVFHPPADGRPFPAVDAVGETADPGIPGFPGANLGRRCVPGAVVDDQ